MTVQLATDILRQVWAHALGLEILADADGEATESDEERLMSWSFFELGGDSLAAIRAMALAQARGLPLALDQFFRCASLPDMARSVASSSLDLREWTSQTLVPLNWAKTTPSASVQALFLFHDADGTVWKLLELARRLPFPVIGVQATVATSNGTCNGLVSTEVRPSSVEQLAESYWTAIRERQRKGPYALGGFSFGCRVAHEVARLAVREGHTLFPVTLLDGLPFELPTAQQNSPDNTKQKEAARCQVEQYAVEAFDGGDSLLRQLGVNYRTHCAMEESYQPYSVTEATVSSPEPHVWLQAELYKTRRWHEDVSQFRLLGVDVATVAAVPNCTHLTMLRHPSVELVARKIRESFARHEMQNAPKCTKMHDHRQLNYYD
ncbi:hypothetical protein BBJ28_00017022 [Nothophytophthora sp. Chile5]|nr:hypothetical protein BBJ28_00017022 [Nothophytophthora sp. Chile5]